MGAIVDKLQRTKVHVLHQMFEIEWVIKREILVILQSFRVVPWWQRRQLYSAPATSQDPTNLNKAFLLSQTKIYRGSECGGAKEPFSDEDGFFWSRMACSVIRLNGSSFSLLQSPENRRISRNPWMNIQRTRYPLCLQYFMDVSLLTHSFCQWLLTGAVSISASQRQ